MPIIAAQRLGEALDDLREMFVPPKDHEAFKARGGKLLLDIIHESAAPAEPITRRHPVLAGIAIGALFVAAIFAILPPILKVFFWWMGVWFPSPY